MGINKINQALPYVWGMYVTLLGILTLYNPDVWQGMFLGFGIGMLMGSIMCNMVWKLVEDYHILTTKMLMQIKKTVEIIERIGN